MVIKEFLRLQALNFRGWKTSRKIIVIESDDWGGIRMPNSQSYNKAISLGLPVNDSPYNRFDTLASELDLEHLFDTLSKHRDAHGKNPLITANVVVCNPDFEKIKQANFDSFFVEDFHETIKRYYPNENVLALWNKGISEEVFFPQFHGREHVNAAHWLKALKAKNTMLMNAFDLGFWGLDAEAYKTSVGMNLQATYNAKESNELEFHKSSLTDGLIRFKNYFGFESKSFIPNNFIFDKSALASTLLENGVRYIQGKHYHINPLYYPKKKRVTRRLSGVENGFVNLLRNCTFEPAQMRVKSQVVQNCLAEISNAFFWNKPAVLTAHRLNFIGTLNEKNRTENLALLNDLLTRVIKKYPQVEFLNSAQLGDEILKTSLSSQQ